MDHGGKAYFDLNETTLDLSHCHKIEIHFVAMDCPAFILAGAPLGRDARKRLGKGEIKS